MGDGSWELAESVHYSLFTIHYPRLSTLYPLPSTLYPVLPKRDRLYNIDNLKKILHIPKASPLTI